MISADELKYWVAFSGIAGVGRVRITQLKEYFGSLQDAWKAPEGKLKQAGLDSPPENLPGRRDRKIGTLQGKGTRLRGPSLSREIKRNI
jgi:predicted Rossmann fold nucleotide-binding protein DprA/Smf involved in DNA uptake